MADKDDHLSASSFPDVGSVGAEPSDDSGSPNESSLQLPQLQAHDPDLLDSDKQPNGVAQPIREPSFEGSDPQSISTEDTASSNSVHVAADRAHGGEALFQSVTQRPAPAATEASSAYPEPLAEMAETNISESGLYPLTQPLIKSNGLYDATMNGMPLNLDPYRTPLQLEEERTMITISDHVSHLFLTKEWVDWAIEVSSLVGKFSPVAYHAHGMVIARSPLLRQKMRQQLSLGQMNNVIILSPDRYIQPPAFEAALRYLYTSRVLHVSEVEQTFNLGPAFPAKLSRDYLLDCTISYWMAGSMLGLRGVAEQGYRILSQIMDWDILELTLQEALVLGEHTNNRAAIVNSSQGTPMTRKSSTATSASSTHRLSGTPGSDLQAVTMSAELPSEYQCSAINGAISRSLKRVVYDFICEHLDISTFDIDTASTSILKSYLPDTREYSLSSRHASNPALAAIRFGDMPLSSNDQPQSEVPDSWPPRTPQHITSAIMLSLRYSDLQDAFRTIREWQIGLLEQVEGQVFGWVSQVVAEREKRRKRVLGSKTVPNQERLAKEQRWHVVGWEERVNLNETRVGGWELTRTWEGFTLPGRQ